MNNTFDFNRFSLLVKRQWIENKKLFLMASVILLVLGLVFYGFNVDLEDGYLINVEGRGVLLIGSIILVGTFFTNYIMRDFSNKNDTTSFLQVPASHIDKFLSSSFYIFIVFPIIFLLFYYLIDCSFVNIGNSIMDNYPRKGNVVKNEFVFIYMMNNKTLHLDTIVGVWVTIQSFIMVGSIYFKRWTYIKTAFTGLVLFFLIYLIAGTAFEILVTDLAHQVEVNSNAYLQVKSIEDVISDITLICLKYIFTPILILIAYFKLKEKQV